MTKNLNILKRTQMLLRQNMTPPMRHHPPHYYTFLLFTFLSFFARSALSSSDTLNPTQSVKIGQTLLSISQVFELGFFNLRPSNWYVGIWYRNIPTKTYVWVANRDNPVTTPSAEFKILNQEIVILGEAGEIIWSTNQTKTIRNPVMQLLDTGNLVLRDDEDENAETEDFLWQSFDHPTDTLLPDMKLGWNLETKLDRFLNSWRNPDDPSTGGYSFKIEFHGFPEIFLWDQQGKKEYRSGPWNGQRFSGVPEMKPLDYIKFNFITNVPKEVYYSYEISNKSIYSRLTVTPSGSLQRYTWIPELQRWNSFWYAPKDQCDYYGECGVYGICDANASPVCKCMKGFEPRNQEAWNLRDGSGGCVRKTAVECEKDKFLHLKHMKLPESRTAFVDRNLGLKDCELLCLKNCSCKAYAGYNISNGGRIGCAIWIDDLFDMRQYPAGGQDLYVRLAASDLGDDGKVGKLILGIAVGVGILLLLGLGGCLLWKRQRLLRVCRGERVQKGLQERSRDLLLNEVVTSTKKDYYYYSGDQRNSVEELEMPLFDFATIAAATDNFSDENRLGEGGFGHVHKGRLAEGQEIAVKRLSKRSHQGIEEFKNEIRLIAKLQHRNLVRLVGCCAEMDEKMLVYEYMERRSLDSVIFNKERSSLLDWQRRFNIICGIARGLLYLHQDSRFRIIHRDLKASNILLDGEWNPKISDFGMARIFGGDQTEANTKRIVGTYGYMSPEYAMDGLFSVKSDVFSFGVLVLEILSGRKNRGFYHLNTELNLLGHAWRLWKEGKGTEILDASVIGNYSYPTSEVLRCIQVGLLCVQERAEDRPTMPTVVLMLSSENATMAQPKTPGYCIGRNPFETDSASSGKYDDQSYSVNQLTLTVLDSR